MILQQIFCSRSTGILEIDFERIFQGIFMLEKLSVYHGGCHRPLRLCWSSTLASFFLGFRGCGGRGLSNSASRRPTHRNADRGEYSAHTYYGGALRTWHYYLPLNIRAYVCEPLSQETLSLEAPANSSKKLIQKPLRKMMSVVIRKQALERK